MLKYTTFSGLQRPASVRCRGFESCQPHQQLRPRDYLRDSETIMELAITGLVEATAVTLHQKRDTQGLPATQNDFRDAGK
jgi:hypothetical protein